MLFRLIILSVFEVDITIAVLQRRKQSETI